MRSDENNWEAKNAAADPGLKIEKMQEELALLREQTKRLERSQAILREKQEDAEWDNRKKIDYWMT